MFFVIPVGVDYRTERYPVVTFSLIGVNVAVWVISLLFLFAGGRKTQKWIIQNLWLTRATLSTRGRAKSNFVFF